MEITGRVRNSKEELLYLVAKESSMDIGLLIVEVSWSHIIKSTRTRTNTHIHKHTHSKPSLDK